MPTALAVQRVDISRRRKTVMIEVTLSGNYTTDGDTVDFTTMTNPNKEPRPSIGRQPLKADIDIKTEPDGYGFELVPAAAAPTLKNWKLICYSSGDTQLAQGAYPANLTAKKLEIAVMAPTFV